MHKFLLNGAACGLTILAVTGCRTTETPAPIGPLAAAVTPPIGSVTPASAVQPLPPPQGGYVYPPVRPEVLPGTSMASPSGPVMPNGAPQYTPSPTIPGALVAAAPCEPPPEKKPWWKAWRPTREQNDPSRERGQFKDGWYEPEYRGISD